MPNRFAVGAIRMIGVRKTGAAKAVLDSRPRTARHVSIPGRFDGQLRPDDGSMLLEMLEYLNPPKGRRPIATPVGENIFLTKDRGVSIPRRVDGRLRRGRSFPQRWDLGVSIPRRVDGRLRLEDDIPKVPGLQECLNPPKGRRPIATILLTPIALMHVSIPRRGDGRLRLAGVLRRRLGGLLVSIPRRVDGRLRHMAFFWNNHERTKMSQSPEG